MNIKTEVRNWMYQQKWDTEITLTFANDISEQQANKALKRFWNRVDKRLYGNAVRNFNKRCERMNVIEGDGDISRFHFHILAKRPIDRFETIIEYCDFLKSQWLIDNSNNYIVTFSPIREEKEYTNYATKSIKRNHCDTLVLDSSHILAAN